jgi:hypothetical protein
MTVSGKLAIYSLLIVAIAIGVWQGSKALYPEVPNNMPRDAHFVQSGYDLAHNDPEGAWVACVVDVDQDTDFCRVTDPHGFVIFEGDFLPLHSRRPVPTAGLRFAARDPQHMWVRGPAEGGPVPVIPLEGGQLLVPAADSEALADRWARDPDELTRLGTP